MRLDFNVLWVDDQPDRVKSYIEAIANYMQEQGFDFKPKQCQTMDEVTASLSDNVFKDEIDLLLVDWELGGGLEGQTVIAEVRTLVQYKDVVFYSAKEPDALRQRAFDAKLEGVYCASRELLVDEVKGVFDALVKKVLDLDHTRGIVMGATSDIDQVVCECLSHLHVRSSAEKKTEMLGKAFEIVQESLQSTEKSLAKVKDAKTMEDVLALKTSVFSAYNRLRVLKSAIPGSGLTQEDRFHDAVSAYLKEVVPDRNILGHQVLVPEGKPQAVIGGDDRPISLEKMRDLRKLLLGLRAEFYAMQLELHPASTSISTSSQ